MRNGSGRSRCGAIRAHTRRSRDLPPALLQVAAFERAQPAVKRPLMVEGQAAAEVGALDERDRQTALRGIIGSEQPWIPPPTTSTSAPAACGIVDVRSA